MKYVRRAVVVFFFQAEDGIRDYKVTGVQTCALPIFSVLARQHGLALNVVDCGVARDFPAREQDPDDKLPQPGQPRLWRRKLGYGTRDCSQGPAMTVTEDRKSVV